MQDFSAYLLWGQAENISWHVHISSSAFLTIGCFETISLGLVGDSGMVDQVYQDLLKNLSDYE